MPKPFFQGTTWKTKCGKSLQWEVQGHDKEIHLLAQHRRHGASYRIPWGNSSSQPSRNQSTNQALQHLCDRHRAGPFSHHFCLLVFLFTLLDCLKPTRSYQGMLRARLCWLSAAGPAQPSLDRFWEGRRNTSWHSCHSEHLHLHHFWSLRNGQGATNRAAKGTRDFLYKNSYLNFIQKGNTKAIQRKATLEFLCKKLRTQGLLKHLITNIHLLFISPIWINHLRNSITRRAEKGYVQEGHTSPK